MLPEKLLIRVAQDRGRPAGIFERRRVVGGKSVPQAVVRVRDGGDPEEKAFQAHELARLQHPRFRRCDREPLPNLRRQVVDVVPASALNHPGLQLPLWQQNTAIGKVYVVLLYPAAGGEAQADECLQREPADDPHEDAFTFAFVGHGRVEELRSLPGSDDADLANAVAPAPHAEAWVFADHALLNEVTEERAYVLHVVVEGDVALYLIEVVDPRLDLLGSYRIESQVTELFGEERQLVVLLPVGVGAELRIRVTVGAQVVAKRLHPTEIGSNSLVNGHRADCTAGLYEVLAPAGDDDLPRRSLRRCLERTVLGDLLAADALNHHARPAELDLFLKLLIAGSCRWKKQGLGLRDESLFTRVEFLLVPLNPVWVRSAGTFEFADAPRGGLPLWTLVRFRCDFRFESGSLHGVADRRTASHAVASLPLKTTNPAGERGVVVDLTGLEPVTFSMSRKRSNQLS
jgi:hypothetical protein